MAKAVNPADAQRIAVYNEMTPALQPLADKLRKNEHTLTKANLLAFYDLGVTLQKVEAQADKFGADSIKQLALYLGRADTHLYNIKHVADTFSRADIEALCKRELAGGGFITFMHLVQLTQVPTVPARNRLQERVFSERLSAQALMAEVRALDVKSRQSTNRGKGVGRKPAKPTSVAAGMQQLFSNIQALKNRFESWDTSLFPELSALPPDDIDEPTLQHLEKIEEVFTALENQLAEHHPKLTKTVTFARKVVRQRTSANNAEAKDEENKLEGKKGRRLAAASA